VVMRAKATSARLRQISEHRVRIRRPLRHSLSTSQ
jgi:hypothetical protein